MSTGVKVTTSGLSVGIEVTTLIDAPAPQAWNVLTATSSNDAWNPVVMCLEGPLIVGERLRADLLVPVARRHFMRVPSRGFAAMNGALKASVESGQ